MIHFWTYRDLRVSFARVAHALARELSDREPVLLVEWGDRRIFGEWRDGCYRERDDALRSDPELSVGFGDIHRLHWCAGRKRVGMAVWETSRIETKTRARIGALDELWVPSSFVRDLLLAWGIHAKRVVTVPHGVDTQRFAPGPRRRRDPFRILSVGKWEGRKGYDVLLQSFRRCFGDDPSVELVLHCGVPAMHPRVLRDLARWGVPGGRNIVFSQPVDEAGLAELYRSADVFALATRGEGWGMPISEAMASGVPPIVTDWSGPRDYVDERVGYPLRVARHRRVTDGAYPKAWRVFPRFGSWAEPCAEHLCERMREAHRERDALERRAKAARERIVSSLTWAHAAQCARERIDALRSEGAST